MKYLIAGNWKMNGSVSALAEITALDQKITAEIAAKSDVVICPPATLIAAAVGAAATKNVKIGAQDCHAEEKGAHTGDLSAEMLAEAGASYIIVGHSERRADHGETDAVIKDKALAALRVKATAIICVGETREEREAGKALDIVGGQLDGCLPDLAEGAEISVAYEPIWAIGTGLVPSTDDIAEVHDMIRKKLSDRYGAAGSQIRILYGGSLKPENAKEILALENVNGGLVGGASLKADSFFGIVSAA